MYPNKNKTVKFYQTELLFISCQKQGHRRIKHFLGFDFKLKKKERIQQNSWNCIASFSRQTTSVFGQVNNKTQSDFYICFVKGFMLLFPFAFFYLIYRQYTRKQTLYSELCKNLYRVFVNIYELSQVIRIGSIQWIIDLKKYIKFSLIKRVDGIVFSVLFVFYWHL